jgi:enoyl-CoA hydratase/carnithine racemase
VELKSTRFDVDGHVATVWLHRPERHNAWTARMHTEYRWILAELESDPNIRAIVVTGTPPAFCVGGDSVALGGHAERGSYDTGLADDVARPGYGVRPEFDHEFSFQFGMRMPVIAAVNGACAGIGLALALFCDLRFASQTARMTTAATKLGLPAEYGLSWILPRLVGVTRANDLLLSARIFTAAETSEWGLWNGVRPDAGATLAAAIDYAHLLAETAGPAAVRMTKRQIYDDLLSHDVGASITTSKRLMNEAMATAEYREGVTALRDKRPPNF